MVLSFLVMATQVCQSLDQRRSRAPSIPMLLLKERGVHSLCENFFHIAVPIPPCWRRRRFYVGVVAIWSVPRCLGFHFDP
jgi:hypothetical protein